MFTPDQLNNIIDNIISGNNNSCSWIINLRGFSFNGTFDLEVFNAIHQIKSNGIGMDDVQIRFLKMLLPHIISIINHIFNTILMTSRYPATWKISKITPITRTNIPCSPADYRSISVLPALSKAMEVIIPNL
jgi:hypothetical protein